MHIQNAHAYDLTLICSSAPLRFFEDTRRRRRVTRRFQAPGVAPLDASALTSLYSAPELGKRYGALVRKTCTSRRGFGSHIYIYIVHAQYIFVDTVNIYIYVHHYVSLYVYSRSLHRGSEDPLSADL